MGPPLALLLLLLLLPPPPHAAPAPRARPLPGLLGCLFEDGLCRPSQTCVNDGVFGRCQEVPVIDVYRYEVSPGVLQHLAATLRKLSRAGLTWQDDYTQHVMAQELTDLPRTYLRLPEAPSPARASQPSADGGRKHSLEEDTALAAAVRHYLPYLQALSQATAPDVLPRTKHNRPPAQVEDPLAVSMLTYMAQTSALTFAPAPRVDYPRVRPLRTLGRLQPDQLSPKVDSGTDRQNLVAALGAYAARKSLVPPRESELEPHNLLHAPWRAARVLPVPAAPQTWPSPPGDPKVPLRAGSEAFIHNLLKDLRTHQVDVDSLSPLDLDKMAHVITGVVQGVGADKEQEGAGRGAGATWRGQADSSEAALYGDIPGNRAQDKDSRVYKEVRHLSFKPGDLLQDPGTRFLPGAPHLAESFKTEIRKSEAPRTSEEENAGVENVKSQTYSREHLELGADGPTELHPWGPGPSQEPRDLGAGAQGHPGEGQQLALKSSEEEEEHGYIVTETDPLSPGQGEELVEDIARLLAVPMRDFADIQVLGPAVTFKVSTNVQNVTAADVSKVAADNRDRLEKMSGLKILQTGTGLKSKLKLSPHQAEQEDSTKFIVLTLISVIAIVGVLLASGVAYCLRHTSQSRMKEKLSGLRGGLGPDPTAAYQSYMEDHLKNKNRLQEEWEALCAYQAEPSSSLVAQREENVAKNRCPEVLTYDHSRILLKSENSHSSSDYINASPIMDHDPRSPAYIATQGPLPATVADFWQMVWESGCVVIVMLTPLSENGVRQCHHYWPDEGSILYHIYEVNLVSEHIWCEDFLVRSFYLKNMRTSETRTVTQFHFLSWYDRGVPSSTRSLLDFRRKVNKCYRGRSCPIIVHCSDGAGRSGTYVLIDMVLNKMAKGAKEIDIAATLEHLRDQRPGMVQTKDQFQFALTAVAEEVNAILRALPQ
ncbi:receptor-type tyrosine-protein phosphatase N2 isoform X3 [Manis pentadactyla]|uniref:receptor-type tyrosine-protein phosphatase N2 isoform X3 n=1 Tax=Manis pentadactyla TaxID=143292 RepID=UPI00255CE54B|nr:receptor-type tyrosine-protein phosphatase N2 isoform X3 [Manis pentadactyla]